MSWKISLYNIKTGSVDLVSVDNMQSFEWIKNESYTDLWTQVSTYSGDKYKICWYPNSFLRLLVEITNPQTLDVDYIMCNPHTLSDCIVKLVNGDTLTLESLTEVLSLIDTKMAKAISKLEKAKAYQGEAIEWKNVFSISIHPANSSQTNLLFQDGGKLTLDDDIDKVFLTWCQCADNFNEQSAGYYTSDDLYVIYNILLNADDEGQIH